MVRVTVASGSRRVDLVLPGSVPVAELLPELARSVGLLDAATVYAGYQLVAPDGRRLASDAGLTIQGIEDGGLLTVTAGVDEKAPRVYDDVVEAMADAVERDLTPWSPQAGRRTALTAACLLLTLGAFALLLQRDSDLGAVAAAVIAGLLVIGGVTLSRAQREREAAICLAWMGAGYAAVAGVMAVPDRALGDPVTIAAAGAGALVAGIVAVAGLDAGRVLVIPAVVVGSIFAASGLVMDAADIADVAEAFTVVLAAVVVAGSLLPWLALSATSTRVEQIITHSEITAEPTPIDPDLVRRDAVLGHELLLAISATVGALLVLIAPMTVGLGWAGTLLVVAASVVVMLRTRQYRAGSQVLLGLASGVLGLLVTAVAVLVLHPAWQPSVAVIVAGCGAVLLAFTLVPSSQAVRRGRLGDVAEVAALVALLPLTVVAIGLVG